MGAPAGEAPRGGWVGVGGRAEDSGGGRWGGGQVCWRGVQVCRGGGRWWWEVRSRGSARISERLNDAGRCVEIGGAPAVDFLARPGLEPLEELKVGLLGGEALDAKE